MRKPEFSSGEGRWTTCSRIRGRIVTSRSPSASSRPPGCSASGRSAWKSARPTRRIAQLTETRSCLSSPPVLAIASRSTFGDTRSSARFPTKGSLIATPPAARPPSSKSVITTPTFGRPALSPHLGGSTILFSRPRYPVTQCRSSRRCFTRSPTTACTCAARSISTKVSRNSLATDRRSCFFESAGHPQRRIGQRPSGATKNGWASSTKRWPDR